MTFTSLTILISLLLTTVAYGQLGTPGDFRDQGSRPVPTVGPPGGPSLPAGPTLFSDPTGTKAPEEVLQQINKQLGMGTIDSSISPPGGQGFEPQRGSTGARSSDRTLR